MNTKKTSGISKKVLTSEYNEFRPGLNIHSVRYDVEPQAAVTDDVNFVFLPGFGVGTFHYERNMHVIADSIAEAGMPVKCYSMDWLGQSKSWPTTPEACEGLRYCATTWCEQLEWFLEQRLQGQPSYLVGNSLGGYIAVQVAARRPDLVKGLVLINPTPIWSFQAPLVSESVDIITRIAASLRPFGWNAALPAPTVLSALGSSTFNLMREKAFIEQMLTAVYADRAAFDDELIENIRTGASHPFGPDAFTSIMFAPKMPQNFEQQLHALQHDLPCLLLNGAEDPWVTPFWGDRTYRRLATRPLKPATIDATSSTLEQKPTKVNTPTTLQYYITPCGHCGHHEASDIVNQLISEWTKQVVTDKASSGSNSESYGGLLDRYEVNGVTARRSFGLYDDSVMTRLAALIDPVKVAG